MSYVYKQSEFAGRGGAEHSLYTVGYYDPQGRWEPESDHARQADASARVAWLNGNSLAAPAGEVGPMTAGVIMHKGTGDPARQFEAVVGSDGQVYGLFPPGDLVGRPRGYYQVLHVARLHGCNVLYHGYGDTPDEATNAARDLIPML